MNKQISSLMQKEMSRKEFLTVVGFSVASIFGFSTFLRLLGERGSNGSSSPVSQGYGSSAYGGSKR